MKTALIPVKHVTETCRIGHRQATCRYLGSGPGGFQCLKHSEFKDLLDQRVANNTMNSHGDNCEGFKVET